MVILKLLNHFPDLLKKILNNVWVFFFHDIRMFFCIYFSFFAFVVYYFSFFVTFACKSVQFVNNCSVPHVPVIWCFEWIKNWNWIADLQRITIFFFTSLIFFLIFKTNYLPVIMLLKVTPPNLINIQGHKLEVAFNVHALACLEIHGQITH